MGKIDELGTLRELTRLNYRPTPCLMETWQTENIPADVWAIGGIVGGGAGAFSLVQPYLAVELAGGGAAGDAVSLYSLHRWFCAPNTIPIENVFGVSTCFMSLNLEFEAKFTTPVNFTPDTAFLGLAAVQAANALANNVIGFTFDDAGDIWEKSDNGGTEHTEQIAAMTNLEWHKFKIRVQPGQASFFIDEERLYDETTDANLPGTAMFVNFLYVTDVAAVSSIDIGVIRVWMEDTQRV